MACDSSFKPAFWLRNPHAQTIFASKLRPMPALKVTPERLELDDGDFLDLSWLPEQGLSRDAPVVLVLHGLNGGLESKYARGLLRQVAARGARGLLLHFRGATRPNRLPRSYHSGETGDLARLVNLVHSRFPQAPLAVVGYSLGANVLLKYLGEQSQAAPVSAAVAVSVPFDLAQCAQAINHGLSRIYRAHLLAGMRAVVREKFEHMEAPIELPDLHSLRDFQAFDDAVTAPLNGFRDAADYYRQSSCGPYLGSVSVPTLVIQAQDDPFMGRNIVPSPQSVATSIRMELSPHGGHVGFVSAGRWGQPVYWLEERIPAWLEAHVPAFGAITATAGAIKC